MRNKKILSINTKHGTAVKAAAARCIGRTLDDVYATYSAAKMGAYREVYNRYETEGHNINFRIVSANSFRFTVAWDGVTEDGTPYTRFITDVTDYWIF